LSVLLIEIEHEGPLARDAQQMEATEIVEHPACRGVLDRLPFWVGEGGLGAYECLSDAIREGGIDQSADGHDHQQGHDPLGYFQIERGGQKAGIFEKPKAAFRMLLPFIPVQQLLRW